MSSEAERRELIKQILFRACELPRDEIASYLEDSCGGDEELRSEVERLLDSDEALLDPLEGLARSPEELNVGGTTFGKYEVLQVLGRGGMGVVYLATRRGDKSARRVALKVLAVEREYDDGFIDLLMHEQEALGRLEHPYIARLYDWGTTSDERPFLVMEYIEGIPIDHYCQRNQLPVKKRLELFEMVCSAVQFAHSKAVVHRDLKPENILITVDGTPKILDFGIAKLLEEADSGKGPTTLPFMTPAYASPEQVKGEAAGVSTDIYTLGVVLYEVLTGRRPYSFSEGFNQEALRIIVEVEPQKPSAVVSGSMDEERTSSRDIRRLQRILEGDLDKIVLMALRKEPERRYDSAGQLKKDIRRHLDALPVLAQGDSPIYRLKRFTFRNRFWVAACTTAMLLLLTYLLTLTIQNRRILRERDRVERVRDFLVGIFEVSDPYLANKGSVTARQLLDESLIDLREGLQEDPQIRGDLTTAIGTVFVNLGVYPQAEDALGQALELRRSVFGEEHPQTAEVWHQLGVLHYKQARYERAQESMANAMRILTRNRRRNAGQIADVLNDRGLLLDEQSRFEEAEAAYREGLELAGSINEPDRKLANELAENLGLLYYNTGRYELAEKQYLELLTEIEHQFGGEHPRTANILHHLALLYQQLGRYDEAEELQLRALRIFESSLGERHPDTATAFSVLGLIVKEGGDFRGALEPYLKALEIRQAIGQYDHPRTATILNNMAVAYQNLDELEEAEQTLERALAINRKVYGEKHPSVATNLSNIAGIARRRGDFPRAVELYQQSLDLAIEVYGPEHSVVGAVLNNIGMTFMQMNRLQEAEGILKRALAVRLGAFGEKHPEVASARGNLALVYKEQEKFEEAEGEYLQALAIYEQVLGESHPNLVIDLNNLAHLYLVAGRLAEAEEAYRRVLPMLEAEFGVDHPYRAVVVRNLKKVLTGLGRGQEAEALE